MGKRIGAPRYLTYPPVKVCGATDCFVRAVKIWLGSLEPSFRALQLGLWIFEIEQEMTEIRTQTPDTLVYAQFRARPKFGVLPMYRKWYRTLFSGRKAIQSEKFLCFLNSDLLTVCVLLFPRSIKGKIPYFRPIETESSSMSVTARIWHVPSSEDFHSWHRLFSRIERSRTAGK